MIGMFGNTFASLNMGGELLNPISVHLWYEIYLLISEYVHKNEQIHEIPLIHSPLFSWILLLVKVSVLISVL